MTFVTIDQIDEETWYDQQEDRDRELRNSNHDIDLDSIRNSCDVFLILYRNMCLIF